MGEQDRRMLTVDCVGGEVAFEGLDASDPAEPLLGPLRVAVTAAFAQESRSQGETKVDPVAPQRECLAIVLTGEGRIASRAEQPSGQRQVRDHLVEHARGEVGVGELVVPVVIHVAGAELECPIEEALHAVGLPSGAPGALHPSQAGDPDELVEEALRALGIASSASRRPELDLLEAPSAARFVRDRELLGRTEVIPGDAPVGMGDFRRKRYDLLVVRAGGVELMLLLELRTPLEAGLHVRVEGLEGEGGRLAGEHPQGREQERGGSAGPAPSVIGHGRMPLRGG